MYDRRDLLQAHRLTTHRMSQALLCGEPDSRNRPLRRIYTASACSVLVAVIAAGAFAVLGLLLPDPGRVTGLNQPGTLVVDTDTATAFVPCAGGELCPAVNFASALLALDAPGATRRVAVSTAGLAGYTIGPPVGIAGLPAVLPAESALVHGPWSVCADNGTTVLAGGVSTRGSALGPAAAALVSAGGAQWLVWDSTRLAIQPAIAQTLFAAGPVSVPAAWLDALPRGPDFAAPTVPGAGQTVAGPSGAGAVVGQVYVQQSPAQSYVLTAGGRLTPVTPVVAALLERVPGVQPARQISPSMAAADLGGAPVQAGGLPATVPHIAAASAMCVVYGAGPAPVVTTGAAVPSGGATSGAVRAWFPPGGGALVRSGQGWFLLAGAQRYPVQSAAAAQALGYDLSRDAVPLPASVTDLLAPGPALDLAAAKTPAR